MLFISSVQYLHHREVKPSGCSCGECVALPANNLAAYISKTQPKMSAVTGAAIRNNIFHVLKSCNGKQLTFLNGKTNASPISRSLFREDLLKKLDKGYNCRFVIVRPETEKCETRYLPCHK